MVPRFVEWQGERYTLEPLRSRSKVTSFRFDWSIRHGRLTLTIFATEGTLSAFRMNSM
jgi:hypothetical protein